VPARSSFDYAIVRVVPRVERGEFLNAGVILFCRSRRFLKASVELDRDRLRVLDPHVDIEDVERHLGLVPLICAGGRRAGAIGQLPLAERFHWLVSPKSTIIQPSPVHSGLTGDPEATLERLFDTLVRPPRSGEAEQVDTEAQPGPEADRPPHAIH
jgi:hypothetical protein